MYICRNNLFYINILTMDKKEYKHLWYLKHRSKLREKGKEYNKTPMGRAAYLVSSYNSYDKEANRGKGDLTAKWVVENIFTKKCAHCDETDWHKLGCNRLDNSKPHTMDNVEPCCKKCNDKLNGNDFKQKMSEIGKKNGKTVYQYTLEGELVGIYPSTTEAARDTGFKQSNISACCLGKRKTYKGFKWSYVPL